MKSELGTLMNIISLRGGAALYNECVHATRSLGGNFPKQNSKFLLIVFFFIDAQSQKNPVSASAMLTGKFLQIRKVFATSSLLAEEFPDTLQYKISR